MKDDKSRELLGGWIATGARFFFTWSIFLLALEIVTFIGATDEFAKILDLFAGLFTILLLLLTTVGLRLFMKWRSKRERNERQNEMD